MLVLGALGPVLALWSFDVNDLGIRIFRGAVAMLWSGSSFIAIVQGHLIRYTNKSLIAIVCGRLVCMRKYIDTMLVPSALGPVLARWSFDVSAVGIRIYRGVGIRTSRGAGTLRQGINYLNLLARPNQSKHPKGL